MRRSRKFLFTLLVSAVAACLLAQTASRRVYTPYSDAQPILGSLADIIPAELKSVSGPGAAKKWLDWARRHDREIRSRLAQGDEDSIINLMLFGASFTKQPRTSEKDLAPLAPGSRTGRQISAEQVGGVILARATDLVAAAAVPGTNERLAFARLVFRQKGFDLATSAGRSRAQRYLLTSALRVMKEQAGFAQALEEARRLGDPTQEFAERSRLYRERGLSLDTSLRPDFAVEESLAKLKQRGFLKPGSVRRVAVIGPGLDFTDKQSGYDFYPEQTIQPFAVMDSLLRLGLADPKALEVTTLDLSPRVNAHVTRARQRAAAGRSYTVQLPRDPDAGWRGDFVRYWERFGDQIGAAAQPAAPPAGLEKLKIRAVRIRPDVAARVRAADLNVVLQRLEGEGFDLIVATNIFVYYDIFEQCLALKNAESMLRPGGFLLSNNALLELPSSGVHSVGYLTTIYSSRDDDGDHIVWYRRD